MVDTIPENHREELRQAAAYWDDHTYSAFVQSCKENPNTTEVIAVLAKIYGCSNEEVILLHPELSKDRDWRREDGSRTPTGLRAVSLVADSTVLMLLDPGAAQWALQKLTKKMAPTSSLKALIEGIWGASAAKKQPPTLRIPAFVVPSLDGGQVFSAKPLEEHVPGVWAMTAPGHPSYRPGEMETNMDAVAMAPDRWAVADGISALLGSEAAARVAVGLWCQHASAVPVEVILRRYPAAVAAQKADGVDQRKTYGATFAGLRVREVGDTTVVVEGLVLGDAKIWIIGPTGELLHETLMPAGEEWRERQEYVGYFNKLVEGDVLQATDSVTVNQLSESQELSTFVRLVVQHYVNFPQSAYVSNNKSSITTAKPFQWVIPLESVAIIATDGSCTLMTGAHAANLLAEGRSLEFIAKAAHYEETAEPTTAEAPIDSGGTKEGGAILAEERIPIAMDPRTKRMAYGKIGTLHQGAFYHGPHADDTTLVMVDFAAYLKAKTA